MALLMVEIWKNLIAGLTVPDALASAQTWLRELSRDDAASQVAGSGTFDALADDYGKWIRRPPRPTVRPPLLLGAFEAFGAPERITPAGAYRFAAAAPTPEPTNLQDCAIGRPPGNHRWEPPSGPYSDGGSLSISRSFSTIPES